ncbi:hypothetical protein [Nitrolancea hollandica]|uniref:hypothetical protein n=1 Tax=Nitrolancea hollandica TaxID=1206749 RepID=UPI0002FB74A7|nr:hypothetical protein [Nitrolancea hollandica]
MAVSSNGRVPQRVGEVIETSTARIWVQSDELHVLPPLGSLVRVATKAGDPIFAVVSFGETGGIDAGRRSIRRGSAEVRDQEVYERHPELDRILRSTFEAVPVAYRQGRTIRHLLPPLPPPLHYSVAEVEPDDLHAVTDDPRYLSILAHYHGDIPAEQLIAAHVRVMFEARGRDAVWLEHAANEISRLFKRDYDQLLSILEAIDPGS